MSMGKNDRVLLRVRNIYRLCGHGETLPDEFIPCESRHWRRVGNTVYTLNNIALSWTPFAPPAKLLPMSTHITKAVKLSRALVPILWATILCYISGYPSAIGGSACLSYNTTVFLLLPPGTVAYMMAIEIVRLSRNEYWAPGSVVEFNATRNYRCEPQWFSLNGFNEVLA
ncbi:hypothetical protein P691DRAFT_784814 [Macrolepiota fuliginosa MF-IS2]|uniref:Uncharacterized protein n=1 Tax=Macrolepiota fuliginosa MF-IS2 TaxID=1400762 RepID=A0A9P5XAJ4_9AGAR|nr:hypothetical protein P691DRAFT_784814 [Macrolepiota fuliginosa MF-IS2]